MSEKMREILFRGKREDNGQWIQGDYQHFHIENDIYVYIGIWGEETRSVKPETVGQFTGLTDKNGKKIFEGDILRAKVYEMEFEDFPGIGKRKVRTGNKIDAVWTVEYKNFNASCGYFIYGKDRRFNRLLTYSVIFNNECEVIGNIHDNPKLLKDANNV